MRRFVATAGILVTLPLFVVGLGIPSSGAAPAAEPPGRLPPRVLAFYYTWYGTPDGPAGAWRHWPEGGHDPATRDERGWADLGAAEHPLDGTYDSLSPQVIRRHARESRWAGIDGWIATWWHRGDVHDQALALALETLEAMGSSLAVTAYYETCGGQAERAVADLEYILERYGGHSRFLKHEGKPVIFIYGRALGELGAAGWLQVAQKVRARRDCLLNADSDSAEVIRAFGSGHSYNPLGLVLGGADMAAYYRRFTALCRAQEAIACVTVLPGYDDRQVRSPGLVLEREGGRTYARLWREARGARPDWILLTSFNEWHEGSEVEPSREHGLYYLEATRRQSLLFHASGRRAHPRAPLAAADVPEGGLTVTARSEADAAELVLLRDRFRKAGLLANLSERSVPVMVAGAKGAAVSVPLEDRAVPRPRARLAALVAAGAAGRELHLSPAEELHLWNPAALEAYLARGGYPGSSELRASLGRRLEVLLFSPLLPPDGRGRRLRLAAGMKVPFRVELRGGEDRTPRAAAAVAAGEPRLLLREGSLELAAGTVPGFYELPLEVTGESTGTEAPLETLLELEVVDAFALEVSGQGGGLRLEARPQVEWPLEGDLVFTIGVPGGVELEHKLGLEGAAPPLAAAFEAPALAALRRSASERGAREYLASLAWPGGRVVRRFRLDGELDPARETESEVLRHVGHDAGGDGRTRVVEREGRRARLVLPAGDHQGYAYFETAGGFPGEGVVTVTVEYLDAGAEWIELHYDSAAESLPHGGAYQSAGRFPVGSTGSWKTGVFVLPDAHFRGRQNFGADFRVHAGGPLVISRVAVSQGGETAARGVRPR